MRQGISGYDFRHWLPLSETDILPAPAAPLAACCRRFGNSANFRRRNVRNAQLRRLLRNHGRQHGGRRRFGNAFHSVRRTFFTAIPQTGVRLSRHTFNGSAEYRSRTRGCLNICVFTYFCHSPLSPKNKNGGI